MPVRVPAGRAAQGEAAAGAVEPPGGVQQPAAGEALGTGPGGYRGLIRGGSLCPIVHCGLRGGLLDLLSFVHCYPSMGYCWVLL